MSEWYNFPENVPKNIPLIVGGYTRPSGNHQGGKWITVIAYFGKFSEQDHFPACADSKNEQNNWVTGGFVTLQNYEVDWKYWTHVKQEPKKK